MFIEHDYIVWGKKCECGDECFVLQNQFHPWNESNFSIKVECTNCGKLVKIEKTDAEKYYNEKIYRHFEDVSGNVIDLGCGSGFISKFLNSKKQITKVCAIDIDSSCREYIEKINGTHNKIDFIEMDVRDLSKYFMDGNIDYIVNRDVFMFVEDTEKYFDDITSIVKKGIRQMGWYMKENKRMKNKLSPKNISKELEKRGWKVAVKYLNWYKCGYFIKADK